MFQRSSHPQQPSDDGFSARLYAIVCLGLLGWVGASIVRYYQDGTLLHPGTLVLLGSLIIAVVYTGYNAWQLSQKTKSEGESLSTK